MNDQITGAPTTPSEGSDGPPSPPTPRPARPEFRRSTSDHVISGVAGGLARTFDVDPVIVRLLTVVIAIAFPPAFIAYLAAWFFVARDGQPSSTTIGNAGIREAQGIGFWIGGAFLAMATIATLDDPFRGNFDILPLVLIGIGVALWARSGGASSGGTPSRPAAQTASQPPASPPVAQPPASPPVPPRPTRPRSVLGAVTLALALIAAGVVAALDQVDGVPLDADWTQLVAVALLVVGLGLLVGAVWGSARWLVFVGLLLLPLVLAGAAFRAVDIRIGDGDLAIGDGIGERAIALYDRDPLPADVRLLAGSVQIDLEDWVPTDAGLAALDASDQDLMIDIGAGEVVVTTPRAVAWRVVADVNLGEIVVSEDGLVVDRSTSDGPNDGLQVLRAGGPPGGPVLDIIVDLRLGEFNLDITTPIDITTGQELS